MLADLDAVDCPQEYDTTECGFAYSTADQVSYCSVQEPPTWPALLQLPEDQYTGKAIKGNATAADAFNISSTPLLYTGNDRRTADALMAAIFARNQSIGKLSFACWGNSSWWHMSQVLSVIQHAFRVFGSSLATSICASMPGRQHLASDPGPLNDLIG